MNPATMQAVLAQINRRKQDLTEAESAVQRAQRAFDNAEVYANVIRREISELEEDLGTGVPAVSANA